MEHEKNIMILQEIKRLTYLVQSNLIREEVLEKNDITQVQSLEDVLDNEQEETLFNCCQLIKMFPFIDDPYMGVERAMGQIDLEALRSLCLLNRAAEETEEEASVKAAAQYERWVNEISMMVFQYAEPEEPEASPLKPYYYGKDLDDLKSKYGLEVYTGW